MATKFTKITKWARLLNRKLERDIKRGSVSLLIILKQACSFSKSYKLTKYQKDYFYSTIKIKFTSNFLIKISILILIIEYLP